MKTTVIETLYSEFQIERRYGMTTSEFTTAVDTGKWTQGSGWKRGVRKQKLVVEQSSNKQFANV